MATKSNFKPSSESVGTMGDWQKHKLLKKGRASRTTSSPGKPYIAVPPAEGWPGGDPVKNGYRRKG